MVCSLALQCRFLLATASRLVNSIPPRRSRIQENRLLPEHHLISVNLGVAIQKFLEPLPFVPLPRQSYADIAVNSSEQPTAADGGAEDDVEMKQEENEQKNHGELLKKMTIPGLNIIQTIR